MQFPFPLFHFQVSTVSVCVCEHTNLPYIYMYHMRIQYRNGCEWSIAIFMQFHIFSPMKQKPFIKRYKTWMLLRFMWHYTRQQTSGNTLAHCAIASHVHPPSPKKTKHTHGSMMFKLRNVVHLISECVPSSCNSFCSHSKSVWIVSVVCTIRQNFQLVFEGCARERYSWMMMAVSSTSSCRRQRQMFGDLWKGLLCVFDFLTIVAASGNLLPDENGEYNIHIY